MSARQNPKQTGKLLETEIADIYRQLGAKKVEHDVELAGNQIDVYIEMECVDKSVHRIAIEAKDWSGPAGIDVVNQFVKIVDNLRGQKLIDQGVIVSDKGFSKPARNAAETYGLRLLEPSDLASIVSTNKVSTPNYNIEAYFFTLLAAKMTDSAENPLPASRSRFVGAIGGVTVGVTYGSMIGLIYHNFIIGIVLGVAIGFAWGWSVGPRVWLAIDGGINAIFVGAIVGGLVMMIISAVGFTKWLDGAVIGAIAGAFIGWLFGPRSSARLVELVPDKYIRSVVRVVFGPLIGISTGWFVGLATSNGIATGKFNAPIIINVLTGMPAGAVVSLVVAGLIGEAVWIIIPLIEAVKSKLAQGPIGSSSP